MKLVASELFRATLSVCTAFLLLGAGAAHGENTSVENQAWKQLSMLQFSEALKTFEADNTPEARLGEALALFNHQPRIEEKLVKAKGILEALQKENPSSESGLAAGYYLARYEQIHAQNPSPAAALARYKELFERSPESDYGQMAIVGYTTVAVLDSKLADADRPSLESVQALEAKLTQSWSKRQFHTVFGNYYLRVINDPNLALPHLVAAAEPEPPTRRSTKAHLYVMVGETAREVGDKATARRFYQKFLDEFPVEVRRTLISERLAALKD